MKIDVNNKTKFMFSKERKKADIISIIDIVLNIALLVCNVITIFLFIKERFKK